MLSQKIRLEQLASFAIVGVGATLTHALVFHILFDSVGLAQLPANIVGFLVAFTVSYLGQFKWTFKAEAAAVSCQKSAFVRFFKTAIFGLLLNLLWAFVTIDWLGLHHYVYLALLTFVTPVVIFALNKFWVFKS
ncbi:GtrA family protein [Motilimonas eburnea]|uniref:GtrA family protein n=1 Tax=Motilimonas eburnea TaxID=1737488 RepID=UPI001E47F6B9|nr:GtrA family protein [Motilimonas eburnea]MCE2573156.1 GtrA family protein [Motilimonas eburnea]